MTNSADPDQLALSDANWSGSTLFVNAGYIPIQQDKGYGKKIWYTFRWFNSVKLDIAPFLK